jgi:hypothetical protein
MRFGTGLIVSIVTGSAIACNNDTTAPPADVRGYYELLSVNGVSTFPIYLGGDTTTFLGAPSIMEHWLLGAQLYLYGTEYRLTLLMREKWVNQPANGSLNGEYAGAYGRICGAWNYFPPEVVFAPTQQTGIYWLSLGSAEATANENGLRTSSAKIWLDKHADIAVSPNAETPRFGTLTIQPADLEFRKVTSDVAPPADACRAN